MGKKNMVDQISKLIYREIRKYIQGILSFDLEIAALVRKKGYRDKRYEKLEVYKNKYSGKRCFICATGPSLCVEDIEKLENEYTFGVNSICSLYEETEWRPDFYVFQDYNIYKYYADLLVNKTSGKTLTFVADPLVDSNFKNKIRLESNWLRFPVNWAYHKKTIESGKPYVKFSDDCYACVYSGYTVVYSALQLAAYMGFKEIYLLGVDCNYKPGKKNHFKKMRNEENRSKDVAIGERNYQIFAYKKAKEYLKNQNVEVINVSRGGELKMFPRRNLEDII